MVVAGLSPAARPGQKRQEARVPFIPAPVCWLLSRVLPGSHLPLLSGSLLRRPLPKHLSPCSSSKRIPSSPSPALWSFLLSTDRDLQWLVYATWMGISVLTE